VLGSDLQLGESLFLLELRKQLCTATHFAWRLMLMVAKLGSYRQLRLLQKLQPYLAATKRGCYPGTLHLKNKGTASTLQQQQQQRSPVQAPPHPLSGAHT
jgi:hypothetical protein